MRLEKCYVYEEGHGEMVTGLRQGVGTCKELHALGKQSEAPLYFCLGHFWKPCGRSKKNTIWQHPRTKKKNSFVLQYPSITSSNWSYHLIKFIIVPDHSPRPI